jgi:hypothetical protein
MIAVLIYALRQLLKQPLALSLLSIYGQAYCFHSFLDAWVLGIAAPASTDAALPVSLIKSLQF